MSDLISISDYAKAAGLSKQAVSKAVARLVSLGLLKTSRDGRSVVFSRSEFERAKRGAGDPTRELATAMARECGEPGLFPGPRAEPLSAPVPGPEEAPYRQAASAEKIAKARKAHIELQQLEGSLLERDKVVQAQINAARAVRNAMLVACATAADRVATLADPKDTRAVKSVITTTIKEALTALADALSDGLAVNTGGGG